MTNPYSTTKLRAHPEALKNLREGKPQAPITVHLMPQNLCNHSCAFCSYRMDGNKNSLEFNDKSHIPWKDMHGLLKDFYDMGVQGIEVTGGGEPLLYPRTYMLWETMNEMGFSTALVTNGTAMTEELAHVVTRNMKWARVSIDAATPKTYSAMRLCPESHFQKAWDAVAMLRAAAPKDPDFRLGVGFVLSNENIDEVPRFIKMAAQSGADNCRISATYSDRGIDYYEDQDAVARAAGHSLIEAKEVPLFFTVHNLLPNRVLETADPCPVQDYPSCPSKDLLCVVEGEGKTFTCCTFTGSEKGYMGNFMEHEGGFRGLWEDQHGWRRTLNPSHYCKVSCLYKQRNLCMNSLIESDVTPDEPGVLHSEFI